MCPIAIRARQLLADILERVARLAWSGDTDVLDRLRARLPVVEVDYSDGRDESIDEDERHRARLGKVLNTYAAKLRMERMFELQSANRVLLDWEVDHNRERLDQAVQKLSDATTELGYAIIQTDDSEDKSLLLAANVVLSTTIAAIHPAPDNADKPGVDKLARTKLARMARAAESKAQQNRRTKRSEGGRLLTGMEAAIKTHLAPLVSGGRLLDRRTAVHQDSTLEGPLVQATWRLCKELDSAACASVLPRITWSREVVARVAQALIGDFDAQGNFNDAELITKHIIRAAHGPLSKLPCRPPYPTGSTVLSVAYLACAEVLCRLALGWPVPVNIIDLLAEFRCTTNGKPVPAGNGLLGALA